MLQLNPRLGPKEIYRLLEETAIDMASPGFDFKTGYGLVDAYAAIQAVIDMASPGRALKTGYDWVDAFPAIQAVLPPRKLTKSKKKSLKTKKNKGKKNAKGKGGGVRG